MSLEIRAGHLPASPRKNILGYPTFNRWGTSLPAAVGTVADAISDARITQDSALMISDGSPDITNRERASHLGRYFEQTGTIPEMPIYVLTQEGQTQVVDELERRLRLPRSIIESVILGTSCGDNRQKMAVISGAYVAGTPNEMVLGLIDDDIEVPRQYDRARGVGETPNSQVIMDLRRNGHTIFEREPNGSIGRDFLDVPGKTIAELKKKWPGFQATQTWEDSMHRQLNIAQERGMAIFGVNPSGEPIQEGRAWGVSTIKHRRPDYRTIEVAKGALLLEFPNEELPIESFPAGESEPFAIRACTTNVDAAFSAWVVDDQTYRLPFSFIISRAISLQNPNQTVTTQTRADNELLPTLLPMVHEKTGTSLVYVTGVPFHVEHLREASGYRPSIIEQAATSLVDNLYAQAANELMEFRDGFPFMEPAAIDGYTIPDERTLGVFRKLQELAQIAEIKAYELDRRPTNGRDEEARLRSNIERYHAVYETVKGKLGVTRHEAQTGKRAIPIQGWEEASYEDWKKAIDETGRDQLRYYNDVLIATPIVTQEVQNMINEGVYPVSYVVPEDDPSISLPSQPTRPVSV